MAKTFYFYDVETSGISPRWSRVMQFAGLRTDMDLNPIGKPDNILIKLTNDVLPDPEAILTHGISPQRSVSEGQIEAEFLKYFSREVSVPGTIMVGYNNIRFDDEFLRFMLWRNFYDAYEWHWKNDCSRWDLLDVVRMTRALRPAGIEWPFDTDGRPSNRLEFLSNVNKLEHALAHDAENDVRASIALANLLKTKQPKLFDYLLNLRDKSKVAALVGRCEPVVYTSGRYPSGFEKTTIVVSIAAHPEGRGAFAYDLRTAPAKYLKMSPAELAEEWRWRPPRKGLSFPEGKQNVKGETFPEDQERFPIKLMAYNRCPAVAPLSVLNKPSLDRLKIDIKQINKNLATIKSAPEFADKILEADKLLQPSAQAGLITDEQQVDGQLYDGFVSNSDKNWMSMVRAAEPAELSKLGAEFQDERLRLLLPIYTARNYPDKLNKQEKKWWQEFRTRRLLSGDEDSQAARFTRRLEEARQRKGLTKKQKDLLVEVELYGQSMVPVV